MHENVHFNRIYIDTLYDKINDHPNMQVLIKYEATIDIPLLYFYSKVLMGEGKHGKSSKYILNLGLHNNMIKGKQSLLHDEAMVRL